jgi:fructose-1,6-bisphosphatase/inositol monophosphatase family enzyme
MSGSPYDEEHCKRACEHVARTIVRPLALRYYADRALRTRVKRDGSIVTDADETIEREIRRFLQEAFPAFGVVGEELPAAGTRNEYVWTIDPLDGTEAFAAGLPLFGTLLAVVKQQRDGARVPVLGAIYLPVQDSLVIGTRNETTMNGAIVRMPAPPPRGDRRLILGDVGAIARNTKLDVQARVLSLAREFRSAQTWGDCAGYVHMLEGKAHARIEAGLGVDDIAPLEPILLGAGGVVSTLEGASLSAALSALPDLADPVATFTILCAANRELHEELRLRAS